MQGFGAFTDTFHAWNNACIFICVSYRWIPCMECVFQSIECAWNHDACSILVPCVKHAYSLQTCMEGRAYSAWLSRKTQALSVDLCKSPLRWQMVITLGTHAPEGLQYSFRLCVCVCVCVCLSITTKSVACIIYTHVPQIQGTIGFFVMFSRFFCFVAFAKNASYGVIYWSLPPFSLPGKLLMDKRDSNSSFQLEKCVYWPYTCRSNKLTSSSLIVVL